MVTWPRIVLFISGAAVFMINWRKDKRGFLLLAFSAIGWAVYDYGIGAYEQAFVMLGNTVVAIISFLKWWYDERDR